MRIRKRYTNFFEFQQVYATNDKCREHLESLRWKDGPRCPHCGHDKYYKFENGKTYKCARRECRKKYNVFIGTVFENTKIPLNKWFWAVYIATSHKKGISSAQLARDIFVQQKTAWFMLHRIREMLTPNNEQFRNTVEIDEAYIGGKERNKHAKKRQKEQQGFGRSGSKTAVLGIVERGHEVYARKVNQTDLETLKPIIESKVEPGATIMTDEWRAYEHLSVKFDHMVIKHSDGIYVAGKIHTNTIEGFWSLLKRGIVGIYHFVSFKHLDAYCNEFTFRYNTRRLNDFQRFELAMVRAAGRRITYKELTRFHHGLAGPTVADPFGK